MPTYHEALQILLVDERWAGERLMIEAAWRVGAQHPIGEKQPCFQAPFSVLEGENIRKGKSERTYMK